MAPTPKTVTLLHLSDLQFGIKHGFEAGGGSPLGSLLDRLRPDLEKLDKEEGLRPDLVLLTGDLTEWGKASEFTQMYDFAKGLAKVVGLPERRLVMIPGNHDINRKLCQAYFLECEAEDRKPVRPYWPKLRPYAEFFARFYEGAAGVQFTEKEPWSFFEYPELGVVVAGLNSTLADSHRDEDHYGWVGEEQIRSFIEKLRSYKERGFLRLGAVHHDVLAPESAHAVQDARDLTRMLGPYINVFIHGHTHEEQFGGMSRDVPVVGIGSAGVARSERPAELGNQYQFIRISADALVLATRRYEPDQKRWIGDLRADPEGKRWLVEHRVELRDAGAALSGEGGAVSEAEGRAGADLALAVERYRQHVSKARRQQTLVDLAGLGEDRDMPGGLDLLRVFVVPAVAREPEVPRRREGPQGEDDEKRRLGFAIDFAAAHARQRPEELDDAPERQLGVERWTTPKPADEALSEASLPWVFLVGGPGSGKTTLTRWLMLSLCAPGETPGKLAPELVPVRVELRRFDLQAQKAGGNGYDFFDYLDAEHREASQDLRSEALKELAAEGRLLWLFDGLDEVTDARARLRCAEMIAGVRSRYGGRGVITSRVVGSEGARGVLEDFGIPTYRLLDFDDARIAEFIEQWHAQAFPSAPGVAGHRRERLERTLRGSTALREVCKTPLLLTMVALLNRGGELPARRHALYARAVEWMAHQWEANKGLPEGEAAQFDYEDKVLFLRTLAWRMMAELPGGSGNVVQEEELLATAVRFRKQQYGESDIAAERMARRLLERLRGRHGILTFFGGTAFGFAHRAFLEYLAAEEIAARFRGRAWSLKDVVKLFRDHWKEPEWEEMLIMLCGLLAADRPEHAVTILQGVLRSIPVDEVELITFSTFSVRCLAELRRLDQEPLRTFALKLTERLKELSSTYPFSSESLLTALRLAGERWPGAADLHSWAIHATASDKWLGISSSGLAYRLALATSIRAERITLLREFLNSEDSPGALRNAIEEASLLGPWTSGEVTLIQQLAAKRGEHVEANVNSALLLSGVSSAAECLRALINSAVAPGIRLTAATMLAKTGSWRDDALRVIASLVESYPYPPEEALSAMADAFEDTPLAREPLTAWLASSNERLRVEVAALLAEKGHPQAIRVLEEQVRNGSEVFVLSSCNKLISISDRFSAAKNALNGLLQSENITDPDLLTHLAASCAQRDLIELARKALELLSRSTHDELTQVDIYRALACIREEEAKGRASLMRLAREGSTSEVRSRATFALLYTRSERGMMDEPLQENLAKLALQSSDENVMFWAALALHERGSGTAAEQGRRVLARLAGSATDEQNRLMAAIQLWRAGIREAGESLRSLAQEATSENIRLSAAREIEDEDTLAELTESAREAQTRSNAAFSRDLVQIKRALLRVGKKRRGIVSLSGQRAGIIEETDGGSKFTYDPAWLARSGAKPISPTLPLRAAPYESEGLHPFFENLLPEGWLLAMARKKLHIGPSDVFGLLLATCGDSIGAVEVTPAPEEEDEEEAA